ncbi:hypothetical protein LX32DRAFT_642939 [Colletotrichum zoysiae]|uniref:Clr5 domain-containing protein n=1 Tax=Colletotrichum zoysiae TaxID=1216348 RepID=A0AAD9LWS1_9PEZI|nr:hypothetical protein LX32DRAFT_642939 [Colletotrichum zoysiae]
MFKTRIKSWGIDKKLKKAEVLHILQLKQEREAAGKNSRVFIRNREVEWERLADYLRRHPDVRTKSRDFARDPTAAARLGIVCRTPSPGPSVSVLLNGPLEARLPDEMLRIFRNYVQGAWESVWTLQGGDLHGYDQESGKDRVRKMGCHLRNAMTLLEQNKLQAAFRTLNQSLDSIGRMIKGQDPEIFYMLSYCILQLGSEVAELLIAFISEMHAAVLHPLHPLSLVWDRLRHLPWECRARTVSMMAFDSAQFLETRLGIRNRVVDSAISSVERILSGLGETDGREFRLISFKYATAAETQFAEGDMLGSCECLLDLARFQAKLRPYEPARDSLARAFALIQDSDRSPGSPWLVMELHYYEFMGELLRECFSERVAESIEYEYKAYKHAEEHFQPGNTRSLRALRNLVYSCRLAGYEEDAEQWCKALLAITSEAEDV